MPYVAGGSPKQLSKISPLKGEVDSGGIVRALETSMI
jgi:hypothetical protein